MIETLASIRSRTTDPDVLRLCNAYENVFKAIEYHHNQTADDRCIEDDTLVYAAVGLPPADHTVGDPEAMLVNCRFFVQNRCLPGGGWKTHKELRDQVSALEAEVESLKKQLKEQQEAENLAIIHAVSMAQQ